MIETEQILIRIVVSLLLGGLVGFERERDGQPAGLRTHMILVLGACLAMILSINIASEFGTDPARIAAQVVSGIGFLGAGAILRFGFNIKGLTTASTLWTMAVIGMVIGHGDYWIGIIATVLILIILGLLDTFEHRFIRASRICEIVVDVDDINRTVHEVREVINANVQRKLSYSTRKSIRHKHLRMEVVAQIAGNEKVEDLVEKISGIEGVRAVKVE